MHGGVDPTDGVAVAARRANRPGVSRLERMVAAARDRTDEETHRALLPVLAGGLGIRLYGLLVVDAGLSPPRTGHAWLKEGATSNTSRATADQLKKLAFLCGLGAAALILVVATRGGLGYRPEEPQGEPQREPRAGATAGAA